MTLSTAKVIVRGSAVITIAICILALALLAAAILRLVAEVADFPQTSKTLIACCLVTVIPLMFVRAAIQAWRLRPKGIESVAAGFLLLGLGGIILSLVQIVFYRGWQSISVLEAAASSLFLLVMGVTVGVQQRRFSQ